jgi:hypothetical protein
LCYNFGRKEEMGSKRRSGEVKKLEIRISMNYQIGKFFNREIMYCALSIIH